jgi:acetylornithine deacetylase/succinyl-diaminopimelate desuccinylase-like protein
MTSLQKVLDSVEANFEKDHLGQIQRFVQQPSVSATGEGIQQTCDYLMDEMRALGAKYVGLISPPPGEFGHPLVYGELIQDAKRPTMLFYSMYDVQPVIP